VVADVRIEFLQILAPAYSTTSSEQSQRSYYHPTGFLFIDTGYIFFFCIIINIVPGYWFWTHEDFFFGDLLANVNLQAT
jgi:hypothetical protein